jgi:hypothetical protein
MSAQPMSTTNAPAAPCRKPRRLVLADATRKELDSLLAARPDGVTLYLSAERVVADRSSTDAGLFVELPVNLQLLERMSLAIACMRGEPGSKTGSMCSFDAGPVPFVGDLASAQPPMSGAPPIGDPANLAWSLDITSYSVRLLARRTDLPGRPLVFRTLDVRMNEVLEQLDAQRTFEAFVRADHPEVEPVLPAQASTGFSLWVDENGRAGNTLPFARVQVDDYFLALLERRNAFCARAGASLDTTYLPSTLPQLSADGIEFDELYWELACNASSFTFEAWNGGERLYKCEPIDTAQLRARLERVSPEASLGSFTSQLGAHVLVSGKNAAFSEVVASRVPEVAAELTAAVMTERVANSLAGARSTTTATLPSSPAARRRRMGV